VSDVTSTTAGATLASARGPAPVAPRVRRRTPFGSYVVLVLLALFTFLPLLLIWFTAFKPNIDTVTRPYAPPDSLYLHNFVEAWRVGRFGTYFQNSVRITIPVVLASVVCSVLAGYALACIKFRGGRILLAVFTIGLMIPTQALLISLFITMRDLHLLDTFWSVIVSEIGFALPFGIFIMRGFFRSLPTELTDAARMDGCSELRLLWHIALPLSLPAVLALAVFQFIFSWNDFLFPLVFLSSEDSRTLPLGLIYFTGKYSTDWALTGAGVIMISAPVILLYILLQRHFVRGIVAGGLRG
jgi:raffinose/stachyose/melibiose transport system permease protein